VVLLGFCHKGMNGGVARIRLHLVHVHGSRPNSFKKVLYKTIMIMIIIIIINFIRYNVYIYL